MNTRLLELQGATYKDLSCSAAADRAAHQNDMFLQNQARFLASSTGARTLDQSFSALQTAAGFTRFDNFANYGTAPGYTLEGGVQGPGQEGWTMHSQGRGASSRLRFDLVFNDGSTPFTYIRASMRGAPDNGKNSYVTLRESRCVNDPNQSDCDEMDLVEYYGYSTDHRAEWTIFKNGLVGQNVGQGRYPAPTDPGYEQYSYSVYLEKGNYINLRFFAQNGLQLGTWERHASEGYVPTQAMYLYLGIWDCTDRDPNHEFCVASPGPFNGDSWCAFQWLYFNTQ